MKRKPEDTEEITKIGEMTNKKKIRRIKELKGDRVQVGKIHKKNCSNYL